MKAPKNKHYIAWTVIVAVIVGLAVVVSVLCIEDDPRPQHRPLPNKSGASSHPVPLKRDNADPPPAPAIKNVVPRPNMRGSDGQSRDDGRSRRRPQPSPRPSPRPSPSPTCIPIVEICV